MKTIFDRVLCSQCKGKTQCDCDECWGRGSKNSPTAAALDRIIFAKVTAMVEADANGESVRDRDVEELLRVLCRLLNGKSLEQAFGAPGDWGYEHPIGRALAEAYRVGA
jgi:hypothetical protein